MVRTTSITAWLTLNLIGVVAMAADYRLELQPDITYQTIDSFGASDAWIIDPMIGRMLDQGNEAGIEHLADLLFSQEKGIGLSGWRFNIGAGSKEQAFKSRIGDELRRAELLVDKPGGNVDPTKQRGSVRFLQEAHERGVNDLVAFVNSPPVWATKNGLAHPDDGTGVGSTNLEPGHLENFTDFLITVLRYLRDEKGVPVNYISPANEPTWAWDGRSQEGNRYNNDELKQLYLTLHQRLQDANLAEDVEVDAGEVVEYTAALSNHYKRKFDFLSYSGGMNGQGYGEYRNYIDLILGDTQVREATGNKISLHGYHSEASSKRLGTLRDLVAENIQRASPDARVWMSEVCILGGQGDIRDFNGDGWDVNDMNYAVHVARIMHRDLTRLNVNAWHWWLGVTAYGYKDGLIKVKRNLDPETVQLSKVYWAVGHYSRFIRPGYQRIELTGADDLQGVMASAYVAPDNQTLVVVAVNASKETRTVHLNSAPELTSGASVSAYLTDNSHDMDSYDLETAGDWRLPPAAVVTIVIGKPAHR